MHVWSHDLLRHLGHEPFLVVAGPRGVEGTTSTSSSNTEVTGAAAAAAAAEELAGLSSKKGFLSS